MFASAVFDSDGDGLCNDNVLDICNGTPNVDDDGDGLCNSHASDICDGFPNVHTDGDGLLNKLFLVL